MVNINAQKWLNEKYPIDGVCKRDSDSENKNKKRDEITILDLSKGKVGKGLFNNDGKTLTGTLKLEGFTKLRKLTISSHQITELDVSECINLIELDCQGNELDILSIDSCSKLKKINCDHNKFLEKVDISNCQELDKIGFDFVRDAEKGKLVRNLVKNSDSIIITAQENDIRNILIVGMTGSGKSTLANVLSDTNDFKESSFSTSATKNFQASNIFQLQGKSYRIIDNIGFGDTASLSKDDILFRIGDGIHFAKEGINQVLFVFKDRFSEEQIATFNLFKTFVNETGITKFTTIVKTGFVNFGNKQRCEEDQKSLLEQSKEIIEIIKSCKGMIYVNNPSIDVDNEDDKEWNKEEREASRKIVLNHLTENCSEIYKLKEWDSIVSKVNEYNSLTKEKGSKEAKNEVVKKVEKVLKGNFGISVPNFPIKFNLGGERIIRTEEYQTNVEVLAKNK